MDQPKGRPTGTLWNGLNRGTARLYRCIAHSWLGRLMTGYRKADAATVKGQHYLGRHQCTPVRPSRRRVVEVMEHSLGLEALRGLFSVLLSCPTFYYGLLFLLAGLASAVYRFAGALDGRDILSLSYATLASLAFRMVLPGAMALLAVPLLLSKKPIAETLGNSWFFRLILVHFLGIPRDRFTATGPEPGRKLWLLALPIVTVLAGLSVFCPLWVLPCVLASLGLVGLLFAYPETGVVLSTVLLPAVWMDRRAIILPVTVILLTWCSYGCKLLFLHRTFRLGLLDRLVLLAAALVLLYGCTGACVTAEAVWQSVFLFICISDYFLIVNLMTTRAYIRRCLLGVSLSIALVTLLSYLRLVPVDQLGWLGGSRAGDAILGAVEDAFARLSEVWVEHSELFLVLIFPWIYAFLLHTNRLFGKILGMTTVALDLMLIVMTDSVSALFCVLAVTVLFFLLSSHRWLSAATVALPALGCCALWITYLYPLSDKLQTVLSRSRLYKSQLADSLWQMVLDHPAGIGVGEDAFTEVYPLYAAPDLGAVTDSGSLFFEILLSYGWIGLLILAAVVFFFLQKSMTCLSYTFIKQDRAMVLGGVTGMVGMLIFGSVRSFITSPRVMFTVMLVVALCSAYENVLFDEYDVQSATWEGSPLEENRLYRRR